MDYTTLVADKTVAGSIANWVNYALLPSASVLEEAQGLIFSGVSPLRCREMQSSATLPLALNASAAPLPTGFLDPLALLIPSIGRITLVDPRGLEMMRSYSSAGVLNTGTPGFAAILDEAFTFDVAADKAISLRLHFYKRPTALGPSNLTNFLTTRYPRLLRCMCLHVAYDFRKDAAESDRYLKTAAALIEAANIEADLAMRGADYPVENR